MTLWTSSDAVKATGGRVTKPWAASGVSIDTRTLQPGELFVALVGPNFDGHEFVGSAAARGAVGAGVSAFGLEGYPSDLTTKQASSAGPLTIQQVGGAFSLTGVGFSWNQESERLVLSNRVQATFRLSARPSPLLTRP
jgi:UDP-N-acetylmuramyl tripeptide synthase